MKIDFDKAIPDFVNGDFKWYVDKYLQNYIKNEQAENLPKLEGLGCYVVKSNDVEDYVLIDNNQNVIAGYPYSISGLDQMTCKINVLKIIKHYENEEAKV